MSPAPDPGGDFDSDTHRRVMAAVPASADNERTVEERVEGDTELDLSQDELDEVLKDLEADGHVKQMAGGDWRHTKSGNDLLTGLPKEERDED